MKILETERLILRHLQSDDVDALFAFYSDPQITQFIPDAPTSWEETQSELSWFCNGHPEHPQLGLWATIHKESQQFIGRCGLLPWTVDERLEVEVAYAIKKEFWGQGLATEAAQAVLDYGFNRLHYSRLVSLIDSDNIASIRVAEKIGMQFEKEGQDDWGTFELYVKHAPTA